jgi:hypothetical protein
MFILQWKNRQMFIIPSSRNWKNLLRFIETDIPWNSIHKKYVCFKRGCSARVPFYVEVVRFLCLQQSAACHLLGDDTFVWLEWEAGHSPPSSAIQQWLEPFLSAPVHLNDMLLREITLFYFANKCVCSAGITDTEEPEYYENLKNV